MSDRGKYHGQRLKAKDVLRLYAAGERDFRGTILRGCNFRGADLSGADFTGADIRSAKFVNATLQEAMFCYAHGGLQKYWKFFQLILVTVTVGTMGSIQGAAASTIVYTLSALSSASEFSASDALSVIFTVSGQITFTLTYYVIARHGFTIKTFGIIAVAFAIAIAATTFFGLYVGGGVGGMATSIATAVAAAIAVAINVLVAYAANSYLTFIVALFFAVIITLFRFAINSASVMVILAVAVVVANFFLSLYANRRVCQSDPKFENLRIIGLAFAALGGTTLGGADLTGATLAHASLQSTNFADSSQRPTVFTHMRWHQAHGLERSRLGTSNLQDPRVRSLLVTLNGVDQDLSDADLRGVNLAGATLHRINLHGANLNGATLAGAELHGANLTNAQCVGTDFTRAHLTGACLEAWNIDDTTILKDIDCEYVFLKAEPDARGNRERRPHNPDKVFQPGDFEKFFKEMLDTVQILIRNGVDPRAFQAAFEQVMADSPEITRESIQGMEKQGNDVLLTLQVPQGTDKAQVERSWDQGYQLGLEAGYTKGLLQGQTQRAEDVKEVALGFSKFLSSIQINNMSNPINAGDGGFINTGSMEGNVVNLGELSGQVTVQINQLPDVAPSANQRSLKDLLTELQAAIEAETELSDIEKKEALGEVGKLAEAGTQPQDNAMQRMAKRAAANLKSITEPLTEASNLVTVCQTLLPLILAVF